MAEATLPNDLAELPDGWTYEVLGNLVGDPGICYGIVQPGRETEGGVPIVRVNNIRDRRIDTDDVKRVAPAVAEKFGRSCLRGGEVLLTLVGTLGEVAIVPSELEGWNVARAVGVIPVEGEVDNRWVAICLRSAQVQHFIRTRASTTVQSTFNLRDVAEIPIPIPPQGARDAIASILGALDDKIELNRRMNATLESLARAIFKSWFVDFDPVHQNAVKTGAGQMPASFQALATHDPKVLDLFPSTFQDSELGPIPEGWSIGTIGDHVELQRGKTYKSKLKNQPGPFLLGLGTIERNGGFRNDKLVTYGGDSPDNLLMYPGDLYVSLKDVTQSADLLGAVARVPTSVEVGRLTQDTVKLVLADDSVSSNILYRTLLTPAYRDYCRNYATGTTNLGLAREDFLGYPVIVPPSGLQKAFDDFMSQLEGEIDTNERESSSLGKLRDTLLPQLLSGELPVPAALTRAEEALA